MIRPLMCGSSAPKSYGKSGSVYVSGATGHSSRLGAVIRAYPAMAFEIRRRFGSRRGRVAVSRHAGSGRSPMAANPPGVLVDPAGQEIGKVTDVIPDPVDLEPEWLVVRPSRFGKEYLVPLVAVEQREHDFLAPFEKEV